MSGALQARASPSSGRRIKAWEKRNTKQRSNTKEAIPQTGMPSEPALQAAGVNSGSLRTSCANKQTVEVGRRIHPDSSASSALHL